MSTLKEITPKKLSITIILTIIVMLFLFNACSDEKLDIVDHLKSREELPRLTASNISTIISDSGITRYRITTPKWKVYDQTDEPFWLFPQGINFERFDEQFKVDAEMRSDSAKYLENLSLWEFNGNVKAKNIKGEYFESEQMFWDEKNKRIYSNIDIKITQQSKIIKGVGFESNSDLTNYTIRQPKGIIPLDQEE